MEATQITVTILHLLVGYVCTLIRKYGIYRNYLLSKAYKIRNVEKAVLKNIALMNPTYFNAQLDFCNMDTYCSQKNDLIKKMQELVSTSER